LDVAVRTVAFVPEEGLSAKVAACGLAADRATFHRDNPWLTTLYLQGILVGEDAQTDARRGLLTPSEAVVSNGPPPRYSLDDSRAVASALVSECAGKPNGIVARGRRLLAEARDAAGISRLDWIDERGRSALQLEVDAIGVLFDLCVAIAYGMNRRGVGKVPALHVEGRQTRDGDWIDASPDDVASADMILDALAVRAFLWFTGAARRGESEVCDFEPVRRRVADPDSADYIVGMVQDAVAAARCRELHANGEPAPVKERLDAPMAADDDDGGRTMLDTLSTDESVDEKADLDRARFFAHVVGALSPRLFRYFKLIRNGTPKMKALEAIGAKSAHFVEREAKLLVEQLEAHEDEDFQELANLLRPLCGR